MQVPRPIRLGVLVSHPIQYYSPWFRHLATLLDLTVYYAHHQGAKGQAQAGFGVEFEWDVPLLDGYKHQFLQNVANRPGLNGFFGCDTPEIARHIRHGAFDAFLCIGWNRKCYWQAMVACRKERVPILMRGDSQLRKRRSLATVMLKEIPYRIFLPRIDAHLFVGTRNREYLKRFGVRDENLFYCPHFVDNTHFNRGSELAHVNGISSKLRESFGISQSDFVALYVGKLIAQKRPQDLVDAVKLASKVCQRIHVVFVGSGPMEEQCRVAAKGLSNIHFAGFQNQSALPAFYRMADALVLPSEDETWGLVVNEAMACGTACVISDACGCAPDMIKEESPNQIYSCGDVKALHGVLEFMAKNGLHRRTAMRDAAKRFITHFSMEGASSGLLAAISSSSRMRETHMRAIYKET